jgi:hypothetical protein
VKPIGIISSGDADMNENLLKILDGLQARFEGELRGSRAAISHPTSRGDASENDWLRLFREHVPWRYQADKAVIIDSAGNCSEQIDIVIYDRQYSPLLYNQADQRYVPAESVYAVIEAKQDLDRDHVLYAAGKAESVRKLHRTSAPISYASGKYEPRSLPRIIAGIVAYESTWMPPFGDALVNALKSLGPDSELDIGCALVNGVFEAEYSSGIDVSLTTVGATHSLVQFLFRLLRSLQAMATAPAIEYNKYLSAFE